MLPLHSRLRVGRPYLLLRLSCFLLAVLALCSPVVAGELRGRVTIDDASRGGVEVLALPFESPLEEARREARGEPAPEPLARALSGDDGQFRMALPEGIDAGGVSLVFGGDGLIGSRLVRVFGPEDVADVGNVTLAEGRSLAGTVVDPSGGPVVGARVTLWAGWFDFGPATFAAAFRQSPPPTTVTTGPDGRFRFADAARQRNRLRIEALGFGTLELRGLPEGALRKPVALAPGRSISGVVLLPDGRRPAAGAVVRFEGSGASPWVEARPDGAFLLEDLSAEPGALVADAGPDGRAEVQLGRDQVEARIVLSQPARLQGRVLDVLAERPVAGVRVLALDGDDTYLGVSAANGAFEIAGLPARHYRLRVEDPRFVPWSRDDLALSVGETTTQDIPLTRGAGLELLVVDEYGAPVADASVTLVRGGESGFRSFLSRLNDEGALRTDGGGRLQAARLTPGAGQSLTVRHEDYEVQTLGGIELSAGQTVRGLTVVLRRGLGIRGLVVDSEGSPVGGAQVRLSRNRRFGDRMRVVMSDRPRSEETGPDGSFEILGLSAEEYSLGVSKPSYVRIEMESVRPVEPGVGEPLEITLRPGAALSGLVSTRSGEPRPGQMVIALPASADEGPARGGRPRSAWVQADEPSGPDGSFQIQGLEPGQRYDVQVLVDGAPTPALQGVAAPADGLMLTVSGYGGIRGAVLDEAGHPVSDFQVSYRPDQGGMRMFIGGGSSRPGFGESRLPVHAEDGSFLLEDVTAGLCAVEVLADGYQPGRVANVSVEEGRVTEGVEVRLARGLRIRGRVVEGRSGRPVVDASVEAALANDTRFAFSPFGQSPNSARSDADGAFEIDGLAPGPYKVTARHADWSEGSATVELGDRPAQVELRLEEGATIAGSVVSGGAPVSGAAVALSPVGESPFARGFEDRSAVTGPGGRFVFERLNPGRYSLRASQGDRQSLAVEVAVTASGAAQDVTLLLDSTGARIRGQVTGLPPSALGGLDVSASWEGGYQGARTAADGSFEVDGVPPGIVRVGVSVGSFLGSMRSETAQVQIAEGQLEAAVEVRFDGGFRVEGRVTRGGEPVARAQVFAAPEGGGGGWSRAEADASGHYALEGLGEGSYSFSASLRDAAGQVRRTVELTGDATVDLEIPVGEIAGFAVDADSGRPLADVEVTATDGERWASNCRSDSNGRFVLTALEEKSYRLTFRKSAYQTEVREVAALGAEITVELERGEGLEVVALDGIYGTPLRQLNVVAESGQGLPLASGPIQLDAEGRGSIPALEPGVYALRLWSDGYAPVSLPSVSIPSSPLSLTLTPGGRLEIYSGAATLERAGASARLERPDGSVHATWYSGDGKIQLRNAVTPLPNVAPGSYVLVTDAGLRQEVAIREGETARVTLP